MCHFMHALKVQFSYALTLTLFYFPCYRNPELLDECDIDEKTKDVLLENIKRRLTPQSVKIRAGWYICLPPSPPIKTKVPYANGFDTDECQVIWHLIQIQAV